MSTEKVESLYLHLIGEWEDGSTYYAGVTGCKVEAIGRLLKLRSFTVDKCVQIQQAQVS